MKKIISVFLLGALLLSFNACSVTKMPIESAEPTGEETASPVPSESPTPTPEETVSPSPDTEYSAAGKIIVTCEKLQEGFNLSDDDDEEVLSYSFCDPTVEIGGNTAASETINKALGSYRDTYMHKNAGDGSGVMDYVDMAREDYTNRDNAGDLLDWHEYNLEHDVVTSRADSAVVSFVFSNYAYLGGVHGYGSAFGVNYDTATGAKLSLEDIADDDTALEKFCTDYIIDLTKSEEYSENEFFDGYEKTVPILVKNNTWYFSAEGLVFTANPYDIAPYAAGKLEFTVPYGQLTELLKGKYLPEVYTGSGEIKVVRTGGGKVVSSLDCTEDGIGETIRLEATDELYDVELISLEYLTDEQGNVYGENDSHIWYCSAMEKGEAVEVKASIPDTMPNLKICYFQAENIKVEKMITQSGETGRILLVDPEKMTNLEYAAS